MTIQTKTESKSPIFVIENEQLKSIAYPASFNDTIYAQIMTKFVDNARESGLETVDSGFLKSQFISFDDIQKIVTSFVDQNQISITENLTASMLELLVHKDTIVNVVTNGRDHSETFHESIYHDFVCFNLDQNNISVSSGGGESPHGYIESLIDLGYALYNPLASIPSMYASKIEKQLRSVDGFIISPIDKVNIESVDIQYKFEVTPLNLLDPKVTMKYCQCCDQFNCDCSEDNLLEAVKCTLELGF